MKSLLRRIRERSTAQEGTVLVLTSLLVVVMLGMAAFAVDYGWIFFNQLKTRKAAEAAALAGVVHMPLPGCADPDVGTEPYTVALDIAKANGYTHGVGGVTVTPSMGGTCNRLTVRITHTVPTFFMKAFGIATVAIDQEATAEQLPPLKIGSDESYLGEDPEVAGRDRDFWLATNGDWTPKGQGDPYTPYCNGAGWGPCTGTNSEFRSPSYWYAFDVPASEAGSSITFQVFDPQVNEGGLTVDYHRTHPDASGTEPVDYTFTVYAPDDTPNDWRDNSSVVCSRTFRREGQAGYDPADMDEWVSLCTTTGIEGIYVLSVQVTGDVSILNAWSLRALSNGSVNNDVAVYGLGSMSLWTPEAGSAPQFKLVKIDEIYAGQELVISLWDVGDIWDDGTLELMNPSSGAPINTLDCQVRTRDEQGGNPTAWTDDDGAGSFGECFLYISTQEHNNEWLDFQIRIPGDYTCEDDECWAYIRYGFFGSTTDRTTWSAQINGQPIHLVP
ncbi:MAG TPA: hypothetical protein ENK55_05205 [Actinobacteria bacterium]|nr:hypothetical protein [Actinomycetota bacterium]